MSCKCATFDLDLCRYECSVSGDGCMFMIPNSKLCAEKYGEGPDAVEKRNCTNCNKEMTEYVIADGMQYYCSDECLHEEFTEKEYKELYEQGQAYWTEF